MTPVVGTLELLFFGGIGLIPPAIRSGVGIGNGNLRSPIVGLLFENKETNRTPVNSAITSDATAVA